MQRNRVEIAGFLSAQPSLRYLPSKMPVANARLGESYRYQDSEGKWQQHTNWHSLSFYGDLARVAMTFEKGDNLFIEGTIEQRQFTPKGDGVQRTVHEIVVRSCHLVAPQRAGATATPAPGVPEESAAPENAEVADHDPWPIG
ncbi:MAG TPA: single-stranded DNA-binding protein [Bryobacteraceae bacterium]|nr:single-stranded DNA-binding protein [Bryobacteraceae bacterium]